MKRKRFLIFTLILIFACIFAFCASAEEESTAPVIPEWSEVQIIDSISPKEGFDTTSRVMLKNSDNSYTVYPAYYILKCTDTTFNTGTGEFDFSVLNNAIADTTGETYSFASVVRLEIPSGFVTVKDRIFRKDKGFTSLMTLKVPEGVTSMGEYNFYQSQSILEVELPNSLENITTNLFAEAFSLKKVVMRGAVTIGTTAFSKCSALETVEWGNSIETIGEKAFDKCTSLTGHFTSNSLVSIGAYAFRQTAITEVTISGEISSMGTNVFDNCDSLVKVTIDGQVIGSYAFYQCDNLKIAILSDNVETLGGYSFADCSLLESVSMGKNIETIGQRAFRKTTVLTDINIPDSVTAIETYAFYQSGITQITVPEDAVLGERAFEGCASLAIVYYNADTVGARAFNSCTALETVVFGENVTTIGGYAFDACSKLENVNLHDGITSIKERAFLNCASIKSLNIPKNLTELGTSAFYGCKGITGTVVIPETLTTLGNNAFQSCASIEKAIIKCDFMGVNMFHSCSKLSVLVLHKDITTIGTDSLSGVANGNFLTIYTGNDPERLKTLNGISRFNTKYIYSYEQYLLDIENGVTYNQNTIIYGADYCIELNGGEHTMNDTPTCVLPSGCIKCERAKGEPALGHDKDELIRVVYITLDQKGDKIFTCTRCDDEVLEEKSAKPVFSAEGYACNPAQTSLTGGFTVDWSAYNDYVRLGGGAIRFGLVAANSEKITEGEELIVGGILNSAYGLQVEMTSTKYSVFSCSINNFSAEAKEKLNLIIALYIIDSEGNISYIQSDSSYVNSSTIGTKTFDTVTLSLVAANAPSNSVMALINKEDE